jgi:hypothetical protein
MDLNTQAALLQAQADFEAEFSPGMSPNKAALPSPVCLRRPLAQTGIMVTPLSAFRQNSNLRRRISHAGLGGTQDLLDAAGEIAFSAAKKDTTGSRKRAKRANFVDSPSRNCYSPPPGSNENIHPSNSQDVSGTPSKPNSQPSSQQQSHRSCLKPLRQVSSLSNSQPTGSSAEAVFPTVSFLPSAPYSATAAIGVPAASWQVGHGQGDEVDDEFIIDHELERSLDEALEFLTTDYPS